MNVMLLNMAGHEYRDPRINVLQKSDADRAEGLADLVLKTNPELVGVTEFAPVSQRIFQDRLLDAGYMAFFPMGFEAEKCPARFTAVTVLFLHKNSGMSFTQEMREGLCPLYRYVAGTLRWGKKTVAIRVDHVACVGTEKANHHRLQPQSAAGEDALAAQLRRKSAHLRDIVLWQQEVERDGLPGLALGDLNGAPGDTSGVFYAQDQLDALLRSGWMDLVEGPTWSNGRLARSLDHILINGTGTVQIEEKEELSDHKIIMANLWW